MFYKTKSINIFFSLGTIINGNVNIACYDLKGFLPQCLWSMSQNYYNTFSLLNILVEEDDNITEENNRKEIIESERSVSIVTQDTTYDYNDACWDYI